MLDRPRGLAAPAHARRLARPARGRGRSPSRSAPTARTSSTTARDDDDPLPRRQPHGMPEITGYPDEDKVETRRAPVRAAAACAPSSAPATPSTTTASSRLGATSARTAPSPAHLHRDRVARRLHGRRGRQLRHGAMPDERGARASSTTSSDRSAPSRRAPPLRGAGRGRPMPPCADQRRRRSTSRPIWQAAEKVVYSRTLETVSTARTWIEREFDAAAVRRMKAEAERASCSAEPTLAAEAITGRPPTSRALFVIPIVAGGGRPRCPRRPAGRSTLLDERRFANGVVYLRYRARPSARRRRRPARSTRR